MPTRARQKGIRSLDLHSFLLTAHYALGEWEFRARNLLSNPKFSDITIFMQYGPDEVGVAVGTHRELLDRLPTTLQTLSKTVLVTAVANLEGYLNDVLLELLLECPSLISGTSKTSNSFGVDGALGQREVDRARGFFMKLQLLEGIAKIDYSDASPGVSRSVVLEVVATRNVLIHSAGIIDEEYAKRVPESVLKIGDPRPLTPVYLNDSLWALEAFVSFVDHKVEFQIAVAHGKPVPKWDPSAYARPPKKGQPRKLMRSWCICRKGDWSGPMGIVGIAAEWSRRGSLPSGDEVVFCKFELEPEEQLPSDPEVIILPELDTPVNATEPRLQARLHEQGVDWSGLVTLGVVLSRYGIHLN